ncbi:MULTISPECIES: hypothetical protein [unclassified Pseudomonas]|uniref:hypothetical protein n=1 Tax=Pseudomonas sp. CCC3.2 TaxID=3048608 RepID=UPI002AB4D700|nr:MULTISPECIES: hypothetical protein [unclassified Pseudomonas]MDY7562591.1 hypothetical protein [Pseudomonas sp. AB6]
MEKHDPNSCRVCLANRPKEKTPQQLAAREEMQKPALAAIAQREARQEALYRRVAEQKKRERDSKVPVFLTIGVFFDGTCNNASNTAMGIMCGAHHPIQPQDLETSCKPYMADADSSYGNDLSKIPTTKSPTSCLMSSVLVEAPQRPGTLPQKSPKFATVP